MNPCTQTPQSTDRDASATPGALRAAVRRLLCGLLVLAVALTLAMRGGLPPVVAQEMAPNTADDEALPLDVLKLGETYTLFYRVNHKPADVLKPILEGASASQLGLLGAGHDLDLTVYGAGKIDKGAGVDEVKPPGVARGKPALGPTSEGSPNDTLIIQKLKSLADVERLRTLLAFIDIAVAQVMIDVRVLVLDHTSGFEFGVDGSLDRAGTTNSFFQDFQGLFSPPSYLEALPGDTVDASGAVTQYNPPPFLGGTFSFEGLGSALASIGLSKLAFRALARRSDIEILASTRLLVQEGATGGISSSEQINIQEVTEAPNGRINVRTTAKAIGISVLLRPDSIGPDSIHLVLKAAVGQISGFTPATAISVPNPIIANREAYSSCTIPNGETLVIGGLIQDVTSIRTRAFPILGDIPILGWLFSSRSRTRERKEVIFIITPHVVSDGTGRPLIVPRASFADSADSGSPRASD